MEKLVYALFGDVSASPAAIAGELFALGARRVAVNVSDEHVAPKLGSRITRLDPTLGAVVSFWLESALDRRAIERALANTASSLAGYSVLESVALSNRTHPASPSRRTPGINMIACIAPRIGQPYDAWLEYWLEEHRRVALEVQASYAYVRNVVVRALTPGAPAWRGIVEEGFDADAVGDPMAWYKAGGSKQRLTENLGRMIASCREFLDLDRVESHPMSEYLF
ncbi:MAG: hypothetical protein FJ108_06625 [Deltaproteobacteria bacterium]|nr:hypothetical protein [Deltaproteobacteria bacterium]